MNQVAGTNRVRATENQALDEFERVFHAGTCGSGNRDLAHNVGQAMNPIANFPGKPAFSIFRGDAEDGFVAQIVTADAPVPKFAVFEVPDPDFLRTPGPAAGFASSWQRSALPRES